jgi:hypothetical protein
VAAGVDKIRWGNESYTKPTNNLKTNNNNNNNNNSNEGTEQTHKEGEEQTIHQTNLQTSTKTA